MERLPGYKGVMQMILLAEERERQEQEGPGTGGAAATIPAAGGGRYQPDAGLGMQTLANGDTVKTVPLTREMVAGGTNHLEGLDGLIETRRVTPQ